MFEQNFKLKNQKSKMLKEKLVKNRKNKIGGVEHDKSNHLKEEKINLKPYPISDEMEDDSVEKIVDVEVEPPNLLEERMKKLANLNKGVKSIINKIDEENEDWELGELKAKDFVDCDYISEVDEHKTVDFKQSINFGNTDLMGVLDYIKNNKGSITIKIEF